MELHTPPRISAWVESVSAPSAPRSTTSTSSPRAGEQHGGGGAGGAGADDDDVVGVPSRSGDGRVMVMVGLISVGGRWAERCAAGGRGGDVVGDERGVVADAVDEVRVAAVLEALAEHVEAGHRRDAAALGISPWRSRTGSSSQG